MEPASRPRRSHHRDMTMNDAGCMFDWEDEAFEDCCLDLYGKVRGMGTLWMCYVQILSINTKFVCVGPKHDRFSNQRASSTRAYICRAINRSTPCAARTACMHSVMPPYQFALCRRHAQLTITTVLDGTSLGMDRNYFPKLGRLTAVSYAM